jgi:hypothetical protein
MATETLSPNELAALYGLSGVVVGAFISGSFQFWLLKKRIDADERIAEKKFEFDKELAVKKFELDKSLAEEKQRLDVELSRRRRKQELAEEVYAGFLEARDILRFARSPFSLGGEGKTRPREPNEAPDKSSHLDSFYVPIERLEKKQEFLSSLLSKRHRMVAWFGSEAREPFQALNETVNRITVSAGMLIKDSGSVRDAEAQKRTRKWQDDIWADFSTSDEVAKKIDDIVAKIDEICRPVLSADAKKEG